MMIKHLKLSRQMALSFFFFISVPWIQMGCGSGTEPFSTLGDPSRAQVAGGLTLPQPFTAPTLMTPFSSASDGIAITGFVTDTAARAPASGLVIATDATNVTILHNVHLVSRINLGTGTVSVPVGTYVTSASQIGTYAANINVTAKLSVFVDGVAMCPLSYLNTESRTYITQRLSNQNPCTQ